MPGAPQQCCCEDGCPWCSDAPANYQVTFSGITLCAGWTGTVNGSYVVPWSYSLPVPWLNCVWTTSGTAPIELTLAGVPWSFHIHLQVVPVGASMVMQCSIYSASPSNSYMPFTCALGAGGVVVPDCNLVGSATASALTLCGQSIVAAYVANGTGGQAAFAAS